MRKKVSRRAEVSAIRKGDYDLTTAKQQADTALLLLLEVRRNREERKMARQLNSKLRQETRDHHDMGDALMQIRMIECPLCKASNHYTREDCFNCGAMLPIAEGETRDLMLTVFGDVPTSCWEEFSKAYNLTHVRMIECRTCGASNHSPREACFHCGAILRVDNIGLHEFVRVFFGDVHCHPQPISARTEAHRFGFLDTYLLDRACIGLFEQFRASVSRNLNPGESRDGFEQEEI
jgi:hypothetical protein